MGMAALILRVVGQLCGCTIVATNRTAIVATIEPVSDPFVQTKNSAIAQTIELL
jgi:hypothetical protein